MMISQINEFSYKKQLFFMYVICVNLKTENKVPALVENSIFLINNNNFFKQKMSIFLQFVSICVFGSTQTKTIVVLAEPWGDHKA